MRRNQRNKNMGQTKGGAEDPPGGPPGGGPDDEGDSLESDNEDDGSELPSDEEEDIKGPNLPHPHEQSTGMRTTP